MNPTDIFNFKLTDTFPGYNSAGDKTKLPAGMLIRGSKNVYKKISGTLASRPGLKRRGTPDATDAGVKSSYEWTTSVGTFRALRVANNKLQVESDIVTPGTYVWYDLSETSTLASPALTYTRFVFDTWWDNDDKSDRLLMVRGDANLLYWSGGIAKIESSTATTITKSGTETWAESGFAVTITGEKKIVINGVEYTYTGGTSTKTLTGVTPSPIAVPVDAVAIQSVFVQAGGGSDMFPSNYKADFIKVIKNQAWVGSYSSRIIYISSDQTVSSVLGFLNFSNDPGTSLIPGDPDSILLDNLARGIGEQDGIVVIFAGDHDFYEVKGTLTPNAFAVTAGLQITTSRYSIQEIRKSILPGLNAALGHEFIGNIGGYLVWVDQKNQLRAHGSFTNESFIKPTTLSLPVQDELSEDNFTGGHLKVIEDTIYITAPNNGRDWMYQIKEKINDDGSISSEKIWQPPQVRGIQRFAVIDGIVYGHSNVNPQIFQIWDTNQWFDDGFLDGDGDIEEISYVWVMRFAYQSHGRQEGREIFDMVYYEGYMPQGVDVRANTYYDYQGASGIRDNIISNDENLAHFYTAIIPSSLGDGSLGDNPLGDGIIEEANDQSTIPKFRDITNIVNPKNFFEYSLEIYCTENDGRFELLRFGPNVRLASENATFLRSQA